VTPAAEARILRAVAELSDALVAAVSEREVSDAPDKLYSVTEAASRLSIGRTALYNALASGRVRSVIVGRRRLIPSSAIAELAAGPPEPRK
jgi:excisionase family DNA binding protein